MTQVLTAILYVCAHYFHLVTTTLLVGGTFFYLLIVPKAIGELREESQRIVFARARWLFRNFVLPSVVLLLIKGAVLTIILFACMTRNARQHLFESIRPRSPLPADVNNN